MSVKALGLISANYTKIDFGTLTQNRTIATLPFGGRYRMIDFPLSNMVNSGITTVGLITPYYYRSIMDHVGVGKPWGLARKVGGLFILPGTVYGERSEGSRFLLKDIDRNRSILDRSDADYVVLCDSSTVLNIDLRPFIEAHIESGCPISLMYKKEKNKANRTYLTIAKNGKLKDLTRNEKNAENMFLGYFIINKSLLLNFLDWYHALVNDDMLEILHMDVKKYNINTYEYTGYSAVIDTLDDYKKANTSLLDHEVRIELFEQDRQIYTKVQDEAPTLYKSTASVKKSLIAAGCIIEGTVENSIVFRSAHIKKGAIVKDSIIMQHTTIESNAVISNAICDKYVHIGRKAHIEGNSHSPIVLAKNQKI